MQKNNYIKLILILICISLGFTLKSDEDIYDKINKNLDIFGKIYKEISLNYVDEIDVDKFFKAGIDGMIGTLDPYTVYYDEKSKDVVDLITTGKYGGIGITIGMRDSLIRIIEIMQGYEAEQKGLRTGDIIKEIDGVNITGMEIDKIRKMVRGTPGTIVSMKIQRDYDIIYFSLTRQEITLKNISYSGYLEGETNEIAYFKLDRFTNSTTNEVENVLKTFKANPNLKGIIFDLRNNSGGLLESALNILEMLVERNSLLLITRGNKKETERKFYSSKNPIIPIDIPLVLLINKNSASASEIVAGAIQDLDRGVILGSRSFGKGLVQQVRDISDDSRLKITVSRYFTPSGRWIQEKNYFLENKSGVFINTESFSQKEFKTLGGRFVYANGGITPDIEINTEAESEIYNALLMKDMFFKFANFYLANYPNIKEFICSDEIYEMFKDYVLSNNFVYQSEANKKINDLKTISDKKKYSENFNEIIGILEKEVLNENEKEFIKAKEEIKRAIEKEINKRIITETKQIEATFRNDIQLQEAIKLLKDINRYNQILGK